MPDAARPQRDDRVAGLSGLRNRLAGLLHGRTVGDTRPAGGCLNAPGQAFGADALNRSLTGTVDVEHAEIVAIAKTGRELALEQLRAAVAVRLEHNVNSIELAVASRFQRRADFGGVVTIVVDNGHPSLLAPDLKAAVNTAERCQTAANTLDRNLKFKRHKDRRHRVQHVMPSHAANRELAKLESPIAQFEAAIQVPAVDISRHKIGIRRDAVGKHRSLDGGQDLSHLRIVNSQNRRAIEWNPVRKFDESFSDAIEGAVVVDVLGVDAGNHRQNRRKLQERPIAFVRLNQQEIALSQTSIRSKGIDPSPDDDRGIFAGGVEDSRGDRSRRCLAVAAGDRDAVLEPHQLGEQFPALDDGNLAGFRRNSLRVVTRNRGADNDRVGALRVFGGVALKHPSPQRLQAFGDRGTPQVGAADAVAEVQKNLSYAAHADAANTDEVNMAMLDGDLLKQHDE